MVSSTAKKTTSIGMTINSNSSVGRIGVVDVSQAYASCRVEL